MATMGTYENRQPDLSGTETKAPGIPHASADGSGGDRNTSFASATRWACKLLLTAVILLGAILFGSELINLWRPLPEVIPTPPISLSVIDDLSAPLQLSFGTSPNIISKQQVTGSMEQAIQQLRSSLHQSTATAPMPLTPAEAAERILLQKLQGTGAVLDTTPDISVHQINEHLPFLVGLRSEAQETYDDSSPKSDTRRVVSWAMATPTAGSTWNLYTFSRQPEAADKEEQARTVAIPPETEPLLRIQSPNGSSLLTFKGTGNFESPMVFYDEYFAGRKWERAMDWQLSPTGSIARYQKVTRGTLETVNIQFHRKQLAEDSEEKTLSWWGIVNHAAHQQSR